jgi:hypothetical protein
MNSLTPAGDGANCPVPAAISTAIAAAIATAISSPVVAAG